MSQTIWSSINPAATSGTQLATILNDFKNAVMSGMSGVTRPSQTTAGGGWIDTSNELTPNFYWSYKVYTGSVDVEVFRVNLVTNRATISGTDSTFEISRTSADSVGPLLKFLKERVASNGQILNGDTIGELRFVGAASDDSNPVCATMKLVALEDQTSSASGTAIVFETTPAGQISAVEALRIRDGKLGIGTTLPEAAVHAHGTTGLKSSTASDDAVGAKMTLKKTRTAGNGSVQASDVIGTLNADAKDSSAAVSTVANIEVSATEGHTSSAKGSIMKFFTTIAGGIIKASKFEIGDSIESKVGHKFLATEFVAQAIATSATLNQVSGANRVVEFTGSTITSVRGFNSAHASKVLLIHNRSTANVTLEHENANATANDRIKLPNSAAITILPQASIELYYCVTDTRWKLKCANGGSGGGGGSALNWAEGVPSPEFIREGNADLYQFSLEDAGAQCLFAVLKVPSTYIALKPITLIVPVYSVDASGTFLIQSVATLIRPGTDTYNSTTNQMTSTNVAITASGGNQNIPQNVTLDLTDSTGKINGVSVVAGSIINIKLQRGSDTAASPVRAQVYASEVTLS